jgi:hypothetical protein
MAHCTPAPHLVADVDALWKGAIGGMALSSSLIIRQDAPTQRAVRAALERKAAAYTTPPGFAAAGRLQGWSWTEAGLSLQSRITALRRSGATGP